MEPQEYDEIIRTLVRIAAHQDARNEDLHASITAQQQINHRLTLAIERIDRNLLHLQIIQARIETLLARIIGLEENEPGI